MIPDHIDLVVGSAEGAALCHPLRAELLYPLFAACLGPSAPPGA